MSIIKFKPQTDFQKFYLAMSCLCHVLRQDIIAFIRNQGSTNVNRIYSSLKLEQSITSTNLGILKKVGIVTATRDGKFVYYEVNERVLMGYLELAKKIATFSSHKIDAKYKRKDLLYYRKALLVMRALNHDYRKAILRLLEEKESMTVEAIETVTKTEQSVVSQHLALLRKANIVNNERNGKYIYYSRNELVIDTIGKEIGLFFKDVKTK